MRNYEPNLEPITISPPSAQDLRKIIQAERAGSEVWKTQIPRMVQYILAHGIEHHTQILDELRNSLRALNMQDSNAVVFCAAVHQRCLDACAARIREHHGQEPYHDSSLIDQERMTALKKLGQFISTKTGESFQPNNPEPRDTTSSVPLGELDLLIEEYGRPYHKSRVPPFVAASPTPYLYALALLDPQLAQSMQSVQDAITQWTPADSMKATTGSFKEYIREIERVYVKVALNMTGSARLLMRCIHLRARLEDVLEQSTTAPNGIMAGLEKVVYGLMEYDMMTNLSEDRFWAAVERAHRP